VIPHDVTSDVPGQVATQAVPALALVEVDWEAAQARCRTHTVRVIDYRPGDYIRDGARRLAVVLRPVLELIVVIETRAAGNRQHLWNDVEVQRYEFGSLPVAALDVFAEGGVGVGT